MLLMHRTVAYLLILVHGVLGENPAGRHIGEWTTPPKRCPSSMVTDGPLLGNGDAGSALGGFKMSTDGKTLSQSFYIGKMDFWTQQNLASHMAYFSHVAPGHVEMQFGQSSAPLTASPDVFHATQATCV